MGNDLPAEDGSDTQIEKWHQYQSGLAWSEPARYAIIRSWERSKAAGLNKAEAPKFRRVTDLQQRLENCAELIDAARPRLSELLKKLPGSSNVVYLTDAHGIVLFSTGETQQLARWGLTPGYDWSEQAMGTNGVGTALAVGGPVAVVGPEHFNEAFASCTCTGVPVRGADRSIVGAIDVSSSAEDARPERLSMVIAVAEDIERELYRRWKARFRL